MGNIYPNINLIDKGVCKNTDSGQQIIANPLWVNNIKINIDTGEEKLNLGYIRRGRELEREVSREIALNPTLLLKEQKYGIDVRNDNKDDIVKHLRNEEEVAEEKFYHNTLGFGEYEGKEIYKHETAIGIDSEYCGPLDIKKKGSAEKVRKLINEEIITYPPALLVMLFSLVSVLVSYLSQSGERNTIIFHMLSNSTVGKSTMCKFGVSLFGSPNPNGKGLFLTYNATMNALFKMLTGVNGLPFVMDELSMAKFDKSKDLVYILASGSEKLRLDKESELKESGSWSGSILSNGEKSLAKLGSSNAGIQVRVFEAVNIKWTKSGKHAEKITKIISDNHSHMGVNFAKYVMKRDKDELRNECNKYIPILKDKFASKNAVDHFTERRLKTYSLVYLTGKLYEEMESVQLDMDSIVDLFIQIEKESIKARNFDTNVLEFITTYVSANSNRFIKKGDKANGEIWGVITEKKGYTEVAFNKIRFEKMLEEGGYEDRDVVLNELKNSKLLSCDKDRYTRKRKDSTGLMVPMIVIKIKTINE